jgi:hypothetical protein
MILFAALASCTNGTLHDRSILEDDPCVDPFWTAMITACSAQFKSGGTCRWDAWACTVLVKAAGSFGVNCAGLRERCAVDVAFVGAEPFRCTGSCIAVTTVFIQIGAGVAALVIVVGVTVVVVCCCCAKRRPKLSHTQQEFGEVAPVTPFGPLPYVPDNDRESRENETIESAVSSAEAGDPMPSNPYDTPTI